MARISMNELTTYRWSFEEDVAQYTRAGIEALAVWRHKLSDFGEERGIELIADSGLKVSSLLWAGGFTGSDGRSHKESVEDAHEAIRLGTRLGAECVIVYSGPRAGHTVNHARRLLTNALRDLLPHAAEAGVSLALEPMHPGCAAEWTFLTNWDETIALIRTVDHPRLKIAFDTYYFAGDEAVVSRLCQWAPHLGIVQLGDARQAPDGEQDRCPLGHGIVPLPRIVAQLAEAGYQGYFDIKLMGQEIESADYQQLLRESWQTAAQLVNAAV
jgi:sugar phosphate isomerase/epimerase